MDRPSTNFAQHEAFGVIHSFDFFKNSTEIEYSESQDGRAILYATPSFNYEMVVQLHASLMWVAWVMCPFGGIFVARYLKSYLGVWWYKIHVYVMTFGTLGVCSIGAILIYLYKPNSSHFKSSHSILGLTIIILMFLQGMLGYICNIMFDPNRSYIPWFDKLHWIMGRSLFLIAIVNVQLGWNLYQALGLPFSPFSLVMTYGFLAVAIILVCLGEYSVGQDNHMAGSDLNDEHSSDIKKPEKAMH